MTPFIGQSMLFGGNFAPRGWALCDGQLLSISSHSALFSILGTTYGGDGVSTFGLPDLRGRVPVHAGQGPGLTPASLGHKSGTETVTLTTAQMPSHHHGVVAAVGPVVPGEQKYVENQEASSSVVVPDRTDDVGGSQPHNNMQPYGVVNFCIALEGVYPSRS
jgi:microcystin-dependent protein